MQIKEKGTLMVNIIEKKKCSGCSACYSVCPVNAINMHEDKEGFLYPVIDDDKCIKCGLCDRICPCINENNNEEMVQKAYAAVSKDEQTRLKSSSGGIFYLFAREVISQGGIVYGAAFDKEFQVIHVSVEDITDIYKVMGSKYVQSVIGESYKDVKKHLLDGRVVLFIGTSCQVAGLKAFLRKNYDNLFTIDLICKSIPSPKIWREYLNKFYKKEKINSINFKDKSRGWDKFSVRIDTDKKQHIIKGRSDYYMQGFFKSLYNRPSCMECNFRYPKRVSDITIADCWGIEEMAPELNDNLGASTIIINTKVGNSYFSKIEENICTKEIDISRVLVHNPYLGKFEKENKARKVFWSLYGKVPFKFLLKVMAFPYNEKIVGTMRKIYHKIRRK